MTDDSSIDDVESHLEQWFPRNILRRTNWLYQVDALRPHDIREMNIIWELCEDFECYARQFIIWAYSIRFIISATADTVYADKLESLVKLIVKMAEMFWAQGYCFFLDFLQIAYYPVTN